MNWDNLLKLRRFGDLKDRPRLAQNDTRLGFEVDYDRIVFSSAFRSLQDKTQIIPFSKTDFVHTRLTHSLEVSVVGRSLGRMAGKNILQKYPNLRDNLGYQINDFGAIVAAASLAHDIGNPPFGHSGEKAIGHYFSHGNGSRYKNELTDKQYKDLCHFEGNANGFKILTESKAGTPGGLRLSFATLGAFIKYPKASLPFQPTSHVAHKKFGYFQAQETFFNELTNELNLNDKKMVYRHPLAYLVEAADDICYTIIDFEDGIHLGWIEEEYALEYLIKLVRDGIDTLKYSKLQNKKQRLSYLRSLAINSLIKDAVSIFQENETQILEGSFTDALMERSQYKAQITDIINISIDKVYKSEEVVQKEILGYKVISSLLEAFVSAAANSFNKNTNTYDELLLELIPEDELIPADNLYKTLLNATCYVASLTDGKAMLLAEKIGFK
ncbi:MAG: dNTP triphosphohydrolase [Bacteroidota bacterium]|nr:dNTP triphosphohydrolase [Bacteroidota bacterium]|tara:strand:+ start:695 stop:2017 length:1323 start_codon:yes stop_codon:yes gene_type:complete